MSRKDKTPKKYQIEFYKPVKEDLIDSCKDERVVCPVCNHYGHIVRHLNSSKKTSLEIEVKIGVNHGHFLRDKKTNEPRTDEGRNVTHYYKQKMIDLKLFCNVRYTLKSNKALPPWLRKRLKDDYI